MESNKIEDIVKNEMCTGCGICVSESNDSLKMDWNENGFLIPKLIKEDNGINAVKVCPFNPDPEEIVKDEDAISEVFMVDANSSNPKIGKFIKTFVGHSECFRETSSSGGMATYIFEQLFNKKIINYLYIVKEVNGSYEYQLFNNKDQIKKISKTRYIPVTMDKLFKDIDSIDGKIAISGVACFIKAIRLKQHYNPELKSKIPFLVGIICGGLKSKFFTDYLSQRSGISSSYSNPEYRIKDSTSTASDYGFGATNNLTNEFHQIKMKQVGDMWGTGLFKPLACEFCTDVTTELADISLGDAWHYPYVNDGLGTNVIITRSNLADEIIKEGILNNSLLVNEISTDELVSSQSGGFNHRHKGLKYRVNRYLKKKVILPKIRKRFYENIPWEFKRVQNYRLKTRRESFEIWKESPDNLHFDKKMDVMRLKLRKRTIFYHRLQKLKKIIGLK